MTPPPLPLGKIPKKYRFFLDGFPYLTLTRGGPASLRIHTQARGADFAQGYKWNIKVTQVYSCPYKHLKGCSGLSVRL